MDEQRVNPEREFHRCVLVTARVCMSLLRSLHMRGVVAALLVVVPPIFQSCCCDADSHFHAGHSDHNHQGRGTGAGHEHDLGAQSAGSHEHRNPRANAVSPGPNLGAAPCHCTVTEIGPIVSESHPDPAAPSSLTLPLIADGLWTVGAQSWSRLLCSARSPPGAAFPSLVELKVLLLL